MKQKIIKILYMLILALVISANFLTQTYSAAGYYLISLTYENPDYIGNTLTFEDESFAEICIKDTIVGEDTSCYIAACMIAQEIRNRCVKDVGGEYKGDNYFVTTEQLKHVLRRSQFNGAHYINGVRDTPRLGEGDESTPDTQAYMVECAYNFVFKQGGSAVKMPLRYNLSNIAVSQDGIIYSKDGVDRGPDSFEVNALIGKEVFYSPYPDNIAGRNNGSYFVNDPDFDISLRGAFTPLEYFGRIPNETMGVGRYYIFKATEKTLGSVAAGNGQNANWGNLMQGVVGEKVNQEGGNSNLQIGGSLGLSEDLSQEQFSLLQSSYLNLIDVNEEKVIFTAELPDEISMSDRLRIERLRSIIQSENTNTIKVVRVMFLMFGYLIIIYSLILLLSFIFDRFANMLDYKLLKLVTFGNLEVGSDDEGVIKTEKVTFITTRRIALIVTFGVFCGYFIITGNMFRFIAVIIKYVTFGNISVL